MIIRFKNVININYIHNAIDILEFQDQKLLLTMETHEPTSLDLIECNFMDQGQDIKYTTYISRTTNKIQMIKQYISYDNIFSFTRTDGGVDIIECQSNS